MRIPYWLLKQLPMWNYICPKCKREVKQKSHKCPYCGENYGVPLRVPPKCLKDSKALEDYVHEHVFPKVSAWQREYLAKYFTTIFAHGFEGGDFGTDPNTGYAWTFSSATIATSPVHHGSYSAYIPNQNAAYYFYKTFASSYSKLYARFYYYLNKQETRDPGYLTLIGLFSDSTTRLALSYRLSSGVRTLRLDVDGTTVGSYQVALTVGQWYCIEVLFDADSDIHKAWLNGELIISGTVVTANTVNRIYLGAWDASSSGSDAYEDCVVVADTGPIGPEVPPKPKGSIVIHAKLAGVI